MAKQFQENKMRREPEALGRGGEVQEVRGYGQVEENVARVRPCLLGI